MSDEFANAIEAGNGSGKAWNPLERKEIIGTYIKMKDNVGPNNSNMYYLQEDGEDEPTGVWGSAVINTRFEEIPIDSRVKITFLGEAKTKRGTTFKDYKVLYVKPTIEQSADAAFRN